VEIFERYGQKRSHGPKEPGQQEKERGKRKALLGLLGQRERVEGGKESGRADSNEWRLEGVGERKKKAGALFMKGQSLLASICQR
jgi:hypothetical protein